MLLFRVRINILFSLVYECIITKLYYLLKYKFLNKIRFCLKFFIVRKKTGVKLFVFLKIHRRM